MWRHPKYYKELRKLRNKLDRVISGAEATAEVERAPGQGLKQSNNAGTLISRLCNKRKGGIGSEATEASSLKPERQASSIKPKRQASSQASSIKPAERQASSD